MKQNHRQKEYPFAFRRLSQEQSGGHLIESPGIPG